MEKQIQLKTKDSFTIYGHLNSSKKTDKLIIFVHGLTGNQTEHHYNNAPRYFNDKGYDTFRFDLYSPRENARQISEVSIKNHVDDLRQVVEYFQDSYSEINIISHSMGCYVVIKAGLEGINKFIYWDPTKGMKSLEEKGAIYNEHLDKYLLYRGLVNILSKEMIEDWKAASNIDNYIQDVQPNSYFIFAGAYNIKDEWIKHVEGKFPYKIVDGATHTFYEEGVLEKLYEYTLDFIVE